LSHTRGEVNETMTPEEQHLDALHNAGQRLRFARAAAQHVRDETKAIVLSALSAGLSETAVAKSTGVDRMTVRSWRGKGGSRTAS